ncbi:MAG: Clp1/GlmU family protein [Desulfohalobiaceae bacterium]
MLSQEEIRPAENWQGLQAQELPGLSILLGGPDSGKTCLARWLVQGLLELGEVAAWIDGDIGQSYLGLPTSIHMALLQPGGPMSPPVQTSFFVGSTNALGRSLALVTGLKRLVEAAQGLGAKRVLVDTTGFIDKSSGGLDLKKWKLELLRPGCIISLQQAKELEPVLAPWRKHPGLWILEPDPAPALERKTSEQRIQNRRRKFKDYFQKASSFCLRVADLPVHDLHLARRLSLVGLMDQEGFCLGLGVILEKLGPEIRICTPLKNLGQVAALRVGTIRVDPGTGLELS